MLKAALLGLATVFFMANANAELKFDSVFNDFNVESFIEELDSSVKEIKRFNSAKIIQIDFDSPGGSIFAGITLLNKIDELKAEGYKFEGRVKRYCASMCFIAFQAMDNRFMLPYAIILDHPASGGNVGNLIEIEEPLKEMAYRRLVGNRSVYNRLVAEEYYINAKNAKFWGLVDKIQPNFSPIPKAKNEKLSKGS